MAQNCLEYYFCFPTRARCWYARKNGSMRSKSMWTQMSLSNLNVHVRARYLVAKHSCSHLAGRSLLFGPGLRKVLRYIILQNSWVGPTFHFKSRCLRWSLWFIKKVIPISELTCGCFESLTYFILWHASMSSAFPEVSHSLMVRGCALCHLFA